MAKVTKVNAGIYDVEVNGKVYDLERFPDGSWLTFERTRDTGGGGYSREFMQDYSTKRAAVAALAALG